VTTHRTKRDEEESWVLLQACPEAMGAQVLAGRLQADGIPARVSTISPIPGLEQNSEVYVPREWLARARQCLAEPLPSEEELAELAVHTPPAEDGEP
jgi:hypothetical protein